MEKIKKVHSTIYIIFRSLVQLEMNMLRYFLLLNNNIICACIFLNLMKYLKKFIIMLIFYWFRNNFIFSYIQKTENFSISRSVFVPLYRNLCWLLLTPLCNNAETEQIINNFTYILVTGRDKFWIFRYWLHFSISIITAYWNSEKSPRFFQSAEYEKAWIKKILQGQFLIPFWFWTYIKDSKKLFSGNFDYLNN